MGNYFPTGDLDRLVRKHGPGKMNRSGNLDGVTRNELRSLTNVGISRLIRVRVKRDNCGEYAQPSVSLMQNPKTKKGDRCSPPFVDWFSGTLVSRHLSLGIPIESPANGSSYPP